MGLYIKVVGTVIIFVLTQTLNVILNTLKSIITVKGSKTSAAAINAVCFGLYTYIIILTANADMPILTKCLIVAACNFIGVWIVKFIEERLRKDKLWEIRVTIDRINAIPMHHALGRIPHSFSTVHKWAIFNCYAETSADTAKILEIAKQYNGKTFASENKLI